MAYNLGSIFQGDNPTKRGGLAKGIGTLTNQNQSFIGQQQGQRSAESGSMLPGYQSLIDSGGYSPTEKASMTQSALGGISNAYGSAGDAASRRMARTGNSADYGSFVGSLARSKARDLSTAGLNLQQSFADEALKRKMAGLQGLASMYGVDTTFLSSLGGQQIGLLGVGAELAGTRHGGPLGTFANSFAGSLGSTLGSAGGL